MPPHTLQHIAFLSPRQHASMAELLCEVYAYYTPGATVSPEATLSHLRDNLLAADSPIRIVTASPADDDAQVVGFAAIGLQYSLVDPTPQQRRQCFVKELFVSTSARSQGAGKALMAFVARFALQNGCHRIDWPVNALNHRGQRFYEGLGAARMAERLSYRLSGAALEQLARQVAGL